MDYLVAKIDLENIHDFNKDKHCIFCTISRVDNMVYNIKNIFIFH